MDGNTRRRAMSWSSTSEASEASARAKTHVAAAEARNFPLFRCMVSQITRNAPWLPFCMTSCLEPAEKRKRLIDVEAQALDGFGREATGFVAWSAFVRFDEHRVHLNIAGGYFETCRQAVQEFLDDAHTVHPDHAVMRPGHADIGDVRGAFGQHTLVGGGHMGMGADDGGDAAVEIPAESNLFASGLRVHVHQHESDVSWKLS